MASHFQLRSQSSRLPRPLALSTLSPRPLAPSLNSSLRNIWWSPTGNRSSSTRHRRCRLASSAVPRHLLPLPPSPSSVSALVTLLSRSVLAHTPAPALARLVRRAHLASRARSRNSSNRRFRPLCHGSLLPVSLFLPRPRARVLPINIKCGLLPPVSLSPSRFMQRCGRDNPPSAQRWLGSHPPPCFPRSPVRPSLVFGARAVSSFAREPHLSFPAPSHRRRAGTPPRVSAKMETSTSSIRRETSCIRLLTSSGIDPPLVHFRPGPPSARRPLTSTDTALSCHRLSHDSQH